MTHRRFFSAPSLSGQPRFLPLRRRSSLGSTYQPVPSAAGAERGGPLC